MNTNSGKPKKGNRPAGRSPFGCFPAVCVLGTRKDYCISYSPFTIFTAFGAGFTWGASYMIWGYDGAAEAAKEPAQFYKEGLMTREEWNALRHHDDNV